VRSARGTALPSIPPRGRRSTRPAPSLEWIRAPSSASPQARIRPAGGVMPKKGKSGPSRPEPRIVRPDDIDPKHRWDRPLQAPGRTQVDFEERIDFRRLHDYRLARTRAALAQSGLGALLCFDQHNIRYVTSTVIGEWARDKLTRYSLLTGNGDPYIWDFGSAAKHHRMHAPWLHHDH